MTYRFKVNQEAVWFVVVASGTVILQALATLDVDKIVELHQAEWTTHQRAPVLQPIAAALEQLEAAGVDQAAVEPHERQESDLVK